MHPYNESLMNLGSLKHLTLHGDREVDVTTPNHLKWAPPAVVAVTFPSNPRLAGSAFVAAFGMSQLYFF